MARNRFILAAGAVLAIIVAVGVYTVVRAARVHTVAVVVAARVIPARTQIIKSELIIVHLPPLDVPADAIGNVVGRWTIHTILPGQPIQRAAIESRGVLTYGLASGDRAFSVPVNTTTAAGGQIASGVAVDVIVVTGSQSSSNTSSAPSAPSAQTLIQDVTILAVEQPSGAPQSATSSQTPASSLASPSSSQTSSGSSTSQYVVTLAVSAGQAQQLAFALGEGDSLYLAVRPPHATDNALAPTTVLPPVPQAGPVVR